MDKSGKSLVSGPNEGELVPQEPQEFKKDSALIHYYGKNMNLVPRKLMSSLIYHAMDQEGPVFRCPVNMILEQIGYTSRDQSWFKEALDYLLLHKVEWNLLGGDHRIGASTFIASYEFVDRNILEYSFSEHLKQRVLRPAMFSVFDMRFIRKFDRVGSLALYETCKRFETLQGTSWESVDVWRKLLDATSPNYDTSWRFMDKVVKPAIEEVNRVSDLHLTLKAEREGRKISRLRFTIEQKAQQEMSFSAEKNPVDTEVFKILVDDFGIAEAVASRYVIQFSEEYIRGNIEVILGKVKAGTIKKNVSGYLVRAIENDYRKKETIIDREQREKAAAAEDQVRRTKHEEEVARLEREVLETRVNQYVAMLTPEARGELFTGMVASFPHMFKYSEAQKEGFMEYGVIEKGPLVRKTLLQYVAGLDEFKGSGN